MSYNFETGEDIGLEVETVLANKIARSKDEALKSLTFPVVPGYFRYGVSPTILEAVRQDYDKYHGLADNRDDAEVSKAAHGLG